MTLSLMQFFVLVGFLRIRQMHMVDFNLVPLNKFHDITQVNMFYPCMVDLNYLIYSNKHSEGVAIHQS